MIRLLRQRHRRLVITLGVFLPVVFAVGIAARKPVPEIQSLPKEFLSATERFDFVKWQRNDLFAKSPVQLRLLREHSGSGKFALALSADRDFVKPDLIVYWVTGAPNLAAALPNDAVLLGSFGAMALPLPDEVVNSTGWLVLFSLADNEIVDVSKTISPNDFTK